MAQGCTGIAVPPENWQIQHLHFLLKPMLISKSCVVIVFGALPLLVQADQTSEASALASQMIQQLGAALKKEIAASGPDGAVTVCRDLAPAIAGELSRKFGGRVTRVSLKIRNPLLGTPDAWEQQVLVEFDRRAAAGEKIESLEYSDSVDEPRGRYFRYMKAIPVQPLCLSCHGAGGNVSDQVRARLAIEYPHDNATGYELGQVRGAITIKHPIGTAQ